MDLADLEQARREVEQASQHEPRGGPRDPEQVRRDAEAFARRGKHVAGWPEQGLAAEPMTNAAADRLLADRIKAARCAEP